MTPRPPRESALPLVGILCSGVGLLFPPLLLVGLGIGIAALVTKKGSQVQAVLAVLVPLVAMTIFGVLLVIALPKFRAQMARRDVERWQRECKWNLKAAAAAERAYFADHEKYEEHPAAIGFAPERGNRYLYLLAVSGPVDPNSTPPVVDAVGVGLDPTIGSTAEVLAAIPPNLRSQLGIHGTCPACSITMLCATNLDTDPTLDVWTISTDARPGIPAGAAHLEVEDLTQ